LCVSFAELGAFCGRRSRGHYMRRSEQQNQDYRAADRSTHSTRFLNLRTKLVTSQKNSGAAQSDRR
jgi:hypothetical protein